MTELAVPKLRKYRDLMRQISPSWLQRGLAEKILYAFAVHLDAFGDAVAAGVMQRFPGAYSFDSLSLLSRERRIVRGLFEHDASFAVRLTRWLIDHRYRGGPYALLAQLHYHYAPNVFDMAIVYVNGPIYRFDAAAFIASGGDFEAAVTRTIGNFKPGNPAKWARWWLIYSTERWATTTPTDAELADLALIPRAWNAAHCFGTVLVLMTGAELWNWPLDRVWNEPGVWNTAGPIVVELEQTS